MTDGPDRNPSAAPLAPTRSRLALASGVMGLVSLPLVCCGAGLSGAIAGVLGMIALERIRSSQGALHGKAWAWTGIASGLLTVLLSVVWFSFANAALQEWNTQLDDGLRKTFAATDDAAAREALTCWSGKSGAGVSVAGLREFATGMRERLGALDSVSLVSQDASAGSLAALVVVHVVSLGFEKGSRSAVISSELRTPVGSWTPTLRLVKIHVNDADAPGGMIEFPPKKALPAGGGPAETNAESKEAVK